MFAGSHGEVAVPDQVGGRLWLPLPGQKPFPVTHNAGNPCNRLSLTIRDCSRFYLVLQKYENLLLL